VEKTGRKRPWKSKNDFHFSHSFNNNKLDDRNHFLQNAKTSVASLRRLITPTRNADHDQPGTLITFIGIRTRLRVLLHFADNTYNFGVFVSVWQTPILLSVGLSENRKS